MRTRLIDLDYAKHVALRHNGHDGHATDLLASDQNWQLDPGFPPHIGDSHSLRCRGGPAREASRPRQHASALRVEALARRQVEVVVLSVAQKDTRRLDLQQFHGSMNDAIEYSLGRQTAGQLCRQFL